MREHQKFYVCKKCGNMIGLIKDQGVTLTCCNEQMTELVPNTVLASAEKHIPDITMSGDVMTVQVGSVAHPMEEGHHIEFIYVETEKGGQRKSLKAGDEPKHKFCFIDDKPVAVYEYCNVHGLWKIDL
ncbi:MAG: desulfoferrodoxin [Clostridiales bacterium]|nr:desulfoferrodoxin [Clostridiales bacterium]